MPVALVTGGSAGLGRALTHALADAGWTVLTDGRRADRLRATARPGVQSIVGDVADEDHRHTLAREVDRLGRLDLLVHNASTLGPLPLRRLRDVDDAHLRTVWEVNTAAPHALTRLLLPHLVDADGVLVSMSSDAAVEHYETWGPYAASKAALDQLTLTVGVEEQLTAYAVDPGDLRTELHQAAFPGEDISDRPLPETVVPALLKLVWNRPASGRYRLADLLAVV
ncbi:SDR family oxidoreductase [Nocardioides sp. W7]|uniref:SDR family NAD(P)-dependent oxidoreductase n=1 Tax=Nocardioides sp. W7 TaxID=2931390 RepID=UPI001FD5D2B5|nr:SDR family oxidoreductase [Nocardioides sp. W7]